MQSQRWTDINAGIQQHLQKLYDTNKASLKAAHWVINPETGTYDVEIAFWNDPRNQARAAQNCQNRAKSTVVCRQGSRSLARLRDEMMASSKELAGEEMVEAAGSRLQHRVGCALHLTVEEDAMHGSKGQARGPFRCCLNDTHNSAMSKSEKEEQVPTNSCDVFDRSLGKVARERIPGELSLSNYPGRHVARDEYPQRHVARDVEKLKKKHKYLTKQVNLMMKLFRSDDKFSQMLTHYKSTPEFGSGSGGCGDDEIADDEDGGEDEEDEEDDDS
ncbi:hypothetical protein Tco_1317830 [Tanacetum coccineum]